MSTLISDGAHAWLDGNSASYQKHPDQTQLEWPLSISGTNETISGISNTGNIIVCKGLPNTAYVGPDKYKRIYRIHHWKHKPILPQMLIHKGPEASSPVWAKYEVLLRKAWVEIPCLYTGSTIHRRVDIQRKRDGRRDKYAFTMFLDGREETFGWRRSKNQMIKDLGLSHNGYKLVRLTEAVHPTSSPTVPRASDRMEAVALAGRSHHVFPRSIIARFIKPFGQE